MSRYNNIKRELLLENAIERNWPPALKQTGTWPLTSLRQSFLNGSLTRLLDPDAVLRTKIVEFVERPTSALRPGKSRMGPTIEYGSTN